MKNEVFSAAFVGGVAIVLMCVSACAASNPTTPTETTGSVPSTTDTFFGTVSQQETDAHPFAVTATGSVSVELTDVEPLTTMTLGVAIGTWNGTNCTPMTPKNDHARTGATALSGTITAGDYCVAVYDSGNIPSIWSVSYTVQVTHP